MGDLDLNDLVAGEMMAFVVFFEVKSTFLEYWVLYWCTILICVQETWIKARWYRMCAFVSCIL